MSSLRDASLKLTDLLEKVAPSVAAVVYIPDFSKVNVSNLEDVLKTPGVGLSGSGFPVAENRFLTCSHVIEPTIGLQGSWMLLFRTAKGEPPIVYEALGAQGDRQIDVALFEGRPKQGRVLPLELDFEPPREGTEVVAIGAPLPDVKAQIDLEHKGVNVATALVLRATHGIVASRVRNDGRFEVDTQFNPGLSGGPIIDVDTGRVVGIVQAAGLAPREGSLVDANLGIGMSLGMVRQRIAGL